MDQSLPAPASPLKNRRDWNLLLVAALAMLIFLANFPAREDNRHLDEVPYIDGSLQLFEGIVPEYKYSPAGPQTWVGWLYAGVRSAAALTQSDVRALPLVVRPFAAVNAALFDIYRDQGTLHWIWILAALPCCVWGAVSAFSLGHARGGLAGGIVGAAALAALPIFVAMTGEARPYAMGWALAVVGLDFALVPRRPHRWTTAAIILGLAVGTRIDMLAAFPLMWSELWSQRARRAFLPAFIRFHAIAAAAALLIAPWILTNLIGNLRIIATVRLSPPPGGAVPFSSTLYEMTFHQGLLPLIILAALGAFWPRLGERHPRFLLGSFVVLVMVSMLKATGFGLQHQGGPLVILIALCGAGMIVLQRVPRLALAVAVLIVLPPLVQTIREIIVRRKNYVPDDAVAWIEQHVQPGTRVIESASLQNLLPTVASSDRWWKQVNDHPAWQKKFQAGLERFHVDVADIPRALSDENMLAERGNRRGIFILGSRPTIGPRFDLHLIQNSQAFGLINAADELQQYGGVLLWRSENWNGPSADYNQFVALAGPPVMQWAAPGGRGAYIFVMPSSRAQLVAMPQP